MDINIPSKISIYSRSLVISFCLLLFSADLSAQYHSLCWRISGNGLKQPSYLFGTIHIADKRVFHFNSKTTKAFDGAKAYAMELDPAKDMSMGVIGELVMTDGSTIHSLIPDSDYQFLDSIVTLSAGFSVALFDQMEPVIVSSLLDQYSMGLNMADSANMSEEMDLYFYKKAKKSKKKLIGIETADEQIKALNTLSYKEQAELLIQSIEDLRKPSTHTDADLLNYYIAQNLDSLLAMSDEQQMPPKFYKALVTVRNIRMADRMAAFMPTQPTFIAVGAMHLPGEGGVIALLRKKGFTVEEWK